MRKLMLLAGVAALTASMPALADDRGRGRGHGQAAENGHKGGGHARAGRDRDHDKAERRGRGNNRADRQERRAERGGNGPDRRAERRLNRRESRVERAIQRERREVREARRDDRREIRRARDDDRRLVREDRRDWNGWVERRIDRRNRFADDLVRFRADRGRRLAVGPNGCPPGLARQNRWCMPPGQLRNAQLIGQRLDFNRFGAVPERYRYRFMDNDRFVYRYAPDGTVLRFDRASGLVSAVVPVFATDLFLGEPLPLGYEVYNVPLAYRGYYPDSRDWMYRYDDGAIYRVDADTMLVDSIVALLSGGTGGLGALGVGDPMPIGYDAYNVPFAHRDTYYDSDQWMYRYADGNIYQIDPETQLIASIISLLV